MHLLHTSSFKLESFIGQKIPAHALLSHTWENEEITFQELQQEDSITLLGSLKTRIAKGERFMDIRGIKKGFIKILGCALQAEKDGIKYIWCDTCCIDKTNSTELSEAINSMYNWYKGQLCYVYLADVPHSSGEISSKKNLAFAESRWFTRGWTLQELIAPSRMVFFDEAWEFMGTRSDFRSFITGITGIDGEVLSGEDPKLFSIAKRMSWASKRETTRVEDIAYCLMGLFGVNMPLLYGEGQKAFLRLQEEIMKISEDHSLFAWKTAIPRSENFHSGLLASSPVHFSKSRNIIPFIHNEPSEIGTPAPYYMTNRGISISLAMLQVENLFAGNMKHFKIFLTTFDCQDTTDTRGPLGIFLFQNEEGYYQRCHLHDLITASTNRITAIGDIHTRNIYVQQHIAAPKVTAIGYQFHLPDLPDELLHHNLIMKVFPNVLSSSWNSRTSILRCWRGLGAAIFIGHADGNGLILLIGIDSHLSTRCAFDDASDRSGCAFLLPSSTSRLELAKALVKYRCDIAANSEEMEELYNNMLSEHNSRLGGPLSSMILNPNYDPFGRPLHDRRQRYIPRPFHERESQLPSKQEFIGLEKNRQWEQWISRTQKDSALLDLGTRRSSKSETKSRFRQSDLMIKAAIHEELVEDRKMYTIRFSRMGTGRSLESGMDFVVLQGGKVMSSS